ncbi:hypothetical protein NB476_12165 [Vibrio sp. RM-44-3]|uniref:hypothetical protein n=1 Tax=unclassified Vibrio TaxID=2614977 RepID=UPI00215BA8AF|nr:MULTISPECIES: hypothetical protein [unclassified Vibrio]MCR9551568.1 hypothetical protein [Vibrio sp. RM-41-2A]MCR9558770.1 hypothetical protein [Vibrio sp. RM-41-2B]MCR9623098.1 hypothetical protein [Vibrio sp. RM-44-3]
MDEKVKVLLIEETVEINGIYYPEDSLRSRRLDNLDLHESAQMQAYRQDFFELKLNIIDKSV